MFQQLGPEKIMKNNFGFPELETVEEDIVVELARPWRRIP